jgi:hypothetical protein
MKHYPWFVPPANTLRDSVPCEFFTGHFHLAASSMAEEDCFRRDRNIPIYSRQAVHGSHGESFNGRLKQTQVVIEQWRVQYNEVRPH